MPTYEKKLPDGRMQYTTFRTLEEEKDVPRTSLPYVPVERVDFLIYTIPHLPRKRVPLWRRVVRWVHEATRLDESEYY